MTELPPAVSFQLLLWTKYSPPSASKNERPSPSVMVTPLVHPAVGGGGVGDGVGLDEVGVGVGDGVGLDEVGVGVGDGVGLDEVGVGVGDGVGKLEVVNARSSPYDVPLAFLATSR